MFKYVFCSLLAVQCVQALTVHYLDNSCDAHKSVIEEEMQLASDMALAASKDIENGDYYKNFFAANLRDQPTFKDDISESFTKISSMASGTDQAYIFGVTCGKSRYCNNPSYYAHMGDGRKTMNFCDRFFQAGGEIKGTNDRATDCQTMDLKEAHRSKAAVLVHEMSHTRYAMLYEDPALDYAYGFSTSYQLALGVFDQSCVPYKAKTPLCPNSQGEEGVCDPNNSRKNADSFALVAAGIYYTQKCNRAILLPLLPKPIFIFNPNSTATAVLPKTSTQPIKASLVVKVASGSLLLRFMRRKQHYNNLK